eukprot:2570708-Pleurochrysis_carterae.AAC.2
MAPLAERGGTEQGEWTADRGLMSVEGYKDLEAVSMPGAGLGVRLEDDREEGRDGQVGDPVEGLADGHERVLRIDGHDLRDDEALHVAHANREGDDDQHHRHHLTTHEV